MFTDKMMMSPWDRWYSTSCCLCCHVRTGTIILGVWYMLINAVVLLILLTALSDPEKYHLTSAELANDLDVMDDAKANRWRARLQAEQPSCFDRAKKNRREPSAQTCEEEEGEERDMRRLRMQETSHPAYATPSLTGIWNDGRR
ncbi:uncharacterized protein LOC116716394 isoform X1 [Xiphophorus hellerii]|uniref:uncharacterized protein LOC116716394 isoform X1 n=2 Tax=Xiphophorus hellerii TaxID=8084 RepID=UPI0013B39D50|nr:uncharacterized protein LOC116716394 isoform X1 [Xiphophorus hellerii]